MSEQDDPILTTRDVAALLGVSVKTAQTWIEQGQIESWKTPGGHRRVRASAVDQLREQLGKRRHVSTNPESAVALVVASGAALPAYLDAVAAAGLRGIGQSDPLNAMLDAGIAMPAVIAVELTRGDWERLSMCRRLLQSRDLAHMRMLIVTDMPAAQVEADVGAMARVTLLSAPADKPSFAAALAACLALTPSDHRDESPYPVADNEAARLRAVERTGLVDSPAEPEFDEVVQLAAETLRVPISLMTVLTLDRQWFKARWGLNAQETPRPWAFCNFTIMQNDVFVVEDAAADPRFAANPLVVGEPRIRFYAGAPLRDAEGNALGALCSIDRQPRVMDAAQKRRLVNLAALASDRIAVAMRKRSDRWNRSA
ncbi:excisionase family DNA-binding protein [Caballeronia sp. LZ062]|uniref:helix-turn-helix domain-containing protein n=1 Tax=unclassified Caballeronia TaxID=2646786 RepID=UPI00285808DF|nr:MULTISPECIES: helix-turn-helix domain-containing protein [unclassified Caballeronia]MDR5857711.1 excisionase family DNA-binding protein [Caballeronia sp. LZ050]MDR5869261.1 excisionase family DNA-binding protein [Caballeronia sp. LZ062]